MNLRLFVALALSGPIAFAAPREVRLPAGAGWLVTAPEINEASKTFTPLLTNTATWSVSLSRARVSLDLAQKTGFRLLDSAHLRAHGVDTSRSWAIFDHGGAQYLGLFLSGETSFDEAVKRWAERRSLFARTDHSKKGLKRVTWSRSKGSRPAAGYARKGDIAVVLLDASGRSDTLESALKAWDSAAPVKAPTDGPLLFWASSWRGAKDAWLALKPRPDGLDVVGSARQAPGWFRRDASRADWVTRGSAPGTSELPLRLRATLNHRGAELLEPLLSLLFGAKAARGIPLGTSKAVEVMSLSVDAQALKNSTRGSSIDHAGVVSPRVRLQLDKASRSPAPEGLRIEVEPSGVVYRPAAGSTAVEIPAGTSGELSCGKTTPVASARLDVAGISRALLPVGLLSAMRDDVLLAVFGVNAEYGHLLRASRPLTALACEDAKGRISYEARWRFTPRVR